MDWIRENWFWIVVIGLFLWMHTKMHGGHGGHGGHEGHGGARGRDHGLLPDEPSRPTGKPQTPAGESEEEGRARQGGHSHAEH